MPANVLAGLIPSGTNFLNFDVILQLRTRKHCEINFAFMSRMCSRGSPCDLRLGTLSPSVGQRWVGLRGQLGGPLVLNPAAPFLPTSPTLCPAAPPPRRHFHSGGARICMRAPSRANLHFLETLRWASHTRVQSDRFKTAYALTDCASVFSQPVTAPLARPTRATGDGMGLNRHPTLITIHYKLLIYFYGNP